MLSKSLRLVSAALALLIGLFVAPPISAQRFHTAYFTGDPDNEVASVRKTEDGGYVGVGHFEGDGVLFKLRASGGVDWARGYGTVRPVAVRPTKSGGFAWIGNVPRAGYREPIFVLTNFVGAIRKSIRFYVAQDPKEEITDLEIDPRDDSFWLAGNWGRSEEGAWLAHLDAMGNVLWTQGFHAPHDDETITSVRFDALVPTLESGAIAVGHFQQREILIPPVWEHYPIAVRVDGVGGVVWSQLYLNYLTRAGSDQAFLDVTRDPRSTQPNIHALARFDHGCGLDLGLPCRDLFTGALVLELRESDGEVEELRTIVPRTHEVTFVPSKLAYEAGSKVVAVGGVLTPPNAAEAEALLARFKFSEGVLGAARYGDGTGPNVSKVADLSLARNPISPATEPGFVLANRQGRPGVDRPTIVVTDGSGHSTPTSCEAEVTMYQNVAHVFPKTVKLERQQIQTASYALSITPIDLSSLACHLVSATTP